VTAHYKNKYNDKYQLCKQQLYGVELELENIPIDWDNTPERISKYVMITKDGSLRNNGIEYVFNQGWDINEAKLALDTIKQHYTDLGFSPISSSRCGLHIHLNMLNRAGSFVDQFVTLIAVIEPVIYKLFSTRECDRSKTRFATPMADAREFITFLRKLNKEGIPSGISYACFTCNSSGYDQKYSGINLMTLLRYGTIELRHFSSTTDIERIKLILDWLERMTTFVSNFKNFELLEYLIKVNSASEQEQFIREMFSEFDYFPDESDLRSVRKNIRLVRVYANFKLIFGNPETHLEVGGDVFEDQPELNF
jgi:hypothetical protein